MFRFRNLTILRKKIAMVRNSERRVKFFDMPEFEAVQNITKRDLICLCNHCSQRLTFPFENVGTEATCPNCNLTTLLYAGSSALYEDENKVELKEDNKAAVKTNEDISEFLKTACPYCTDVFEFPSTHYAENHPCPLCARPVNLVPRPKMTPREYELHNDKGCKGPFSFSQVQEQWKTGNINLNSMYRILPSKEWCSVKMLKLDASDAAVMNELSVYVKFPNLNYPKGPYSFIEIMEEVKGQRINSNCSFWWPGMAYWIDFDLMGLVFETESNPEIAKKLTANLCNDAQMEPPSFELTKSHNRAVQDFHASEWSELIDDSVLKLVFYVVIAIGMGIMLLIFKSL